MLRNAEGGFSICPTKRELYSPSTIQLALRLAELGWLYNTVHSFVEKCNGQKDLGLCGQSMVTGLREELADYYRLLSLLEDQLKSKRTMEDEGMAMTLHKLSVYTMDPMVKLKLLAVIVKECEENKKKNKGGFLLSIVYSHLHHGNKILSGTVRKLLTSMVSVSIFRPLKTIFICHCHL